MALTRLTKITGPGIATDTNWVGDNANYTGIVTATKFVGPVEGSITATDATFSGNVSIAGTLTYEDVTNVDSVGLITARDGIFLPDTKMAKFGNTAADPDLEIYHGGTASYISHSGTGNLFIHSNTVAIRKQNQQAYFVGVNGQSKLYESGNERLVTTDKGIQVGTGVTIETNGQANFAGITTVSGTDLVIKPPTVSTSRIKLGYNEQMKIYVSNANQNVIQSTAAYLQIASNNLNLSRADTNLHMARFLAGQQCKLTYNYIDRIATSGVGATVYGQFDTTNLTIAGVSTFTGNIDANGDLDVDGHTNLDNVSVAGITTFSGILDATNTPASIRVAQDIQHKGDADTLIKFPSNDQISFETGGSERGRFDDDGNFLIGTTSHGNAGSGARHLVISGPSNQGLTINSTNTSGIYRDCNIYFGFGTSTGDMAKGQLTYSGNGDYFHMSVGNTAYTLAKSFRLNGNGTVRFDSTHNDAHSQSLVIKSHKARALNDNNGIVFRDANDHTQAVINVTKMSTSDATSDLVFRTSSGQVVNTLQGIPERMRIKSDGHVLPAITNTQDLGSSSKRWRNVYTTDLQLSNEGKTNDVDGTWGNYTIQEGESDLFLINNRNGKKYVFLLKEVS